MGSDTVSVDARRCVDSTWFLLSGLALPSHGEGPGEGSGQREAAAGGDAPGTGGGHAQRPPPGGAGELPGGPAVRPSTGENR